MENYLLTAKRKTITRLEAIIDALQDSKEVVSHNLMETELIIDRIIEYQDEFKSLTGHYYSRYKGNR